MFLGSRFDDALSAYHRWVLEHGDRLSSDQVLDIYRELWKTELEIENDKQGVDWEEDLPERSAFELGTQAVELALAELVPHLGDPVDVQRRLEFAIAERLEWTVVCYLDLETLKTDEGDELNILSASSVRPCRRRSSAKPTNASPAMPAALVSSSGAASRNPSSVRPHHGTSGR